MQAGAHAGTGAAPRAGPHAWVWLMARRSAQSVLKRAREQALREKRELKQAKKDARAAKRRNGDDPAEPAGDALPADPAGDDLPADPAAPDPEADPG